MDTTTIFCDRCLAEITGRPVLVGLTFDNYPELGEVITELCSPACADADAAEHAYLVGDGWRLLAG